MGIAIDIILVVICALIIASAWRRGFVKSIMRLLSGIISVLAAYAFTPALSNILYDKFAIDWISSSIEKDILSNTESGGVFNLQGLLGSIPEWFDQIITRYGADKDKLTAIFGNINTGQGEDVSALSRYIADPVAGTLSSVAAFIIIFTAVFALLGFVTFLLDAVFHLPLLQETNKALGLLFGVLEALLILSLFGELLSELTVSLGAVNGELFGERAVESSLLLRFLSEHNILSIIDNIT